MERVATIAITLCLASCAHAPAPAIDAQKAIHIGLMTCVNALAKMNPIDVRLANPGFWHSRLEGDHWAVWFGDEMPPFLSANVLKNGLFSPGDGCHIYIHD